MKRSFSVVYAKASTRKHKRWENDGILINQGNKLVLENDGKQIATSYHNNQVELDNLGNGNLLNIGNYEVEIQDEVFEQICVSYSVLCVFSDLQTMLYERIMDITGFEEEIRTDLLSRLCSHPAILYARVDQIFKDQKPYNDIIELFPPCYSPQDCYINESGKLLALFQLVTSLNSRKEKCAIVSKRTNSLDLIEAMFKKIEFDVYRLDLESMTIKEIIIRNFNSYEFDQVLLMNADTTTGGIDIRGCNHLILFDTESWPFEKAIKDRIWKENHRGECCVYRLVTTNSFEEEKAKNVTDLIVTEIDQLLSQFEENKLDETIPA